MQNQGQYNLRMSQGSPTSFQPGSPYYQPGNHQPQYSNQLLANYNSTTQQAYVKQVSPPKTAYLNPPTQQTYTQVQQPVHQQNLSYLPFQPPIANYVPLTLTQQFNQHNDSSSMSSSNLPAPPQQVAQPQPKPQLLRQEDLVPSYSDNQILQQELIKARLRIAELEKQIIIVGPEMEMWKGKFQQRYAIHCIASEQEVFKLRSSVSPSQPDKQQQQPNTDDRDREFRDLVAINQQLMQKLKDQQQENQQLKQQRQQSPTLSQANRARTSADTNTQQELIREYQQQLEEKNAELEKCKLEKLALQKQVTALQSEIKALEKQPTKRQQTQQGCM